MTFGEISILLGILATIGTLLVFGVRNASKFGAMEMKYRMEIDALKLRDMQIEQKMDEQHSEFMQEIRGMRDDIKRTFSIEGRVKTIEDGRLEIISKLDLLLTGQHKLELAVNNKQDRPR